jgi:hypothetical protein
VPPSIFETAISVKRHRELRRRERRVFGATMVEGKEETTKEITPLQLLDVVEGYFNQLGFGPSEPSGKYAWGETTSTNRAGEDLETLLDAFDKGTRILRYFHLLHVDGDLCMVVKSNVDEFKEEGLCSDCPVRLFNRMQYKQTFRCTDRALEQLGGSIERDLSCAQTCSDLEAVIVKAAEENPDSLLILGLVHAQDECRRDGLALLIDCLPGLESYEAKEESRVLGFMNALARQAKIAFDEPVGNEVACMKILGDWYQGYTERHGFLNCNCPKPESRRKEKQKLLDNTTCSIIASSSTTSDSPLVEKILRVSLMFPECLPDQWKNSFEWLYDPDQRYICIQETLVGKGFDDRPSPIDIRFVLDGYMQHRNCLVNHGLDNEDTSYKAVVVNLLDKMSPDEFCLALYWGIEDGVRKTDLSVLKFRLPGIKKEKSGDLILIRFDRKNCGYCDKEEKISRTFACCAVCKRVHYCSNQCQQMHWKYGHKTECKRASSQWTN